MKDPRDYLNYDSDKELPTLDQDIKKLKKQLKKGKDVGVKYSKAIEQRKEVVNKLRKKYRIKVEGDEIPAPIDSFLKMQNLC